MFARLNPFNKEKKYYQDYLKFCIQTTDSLNELSITHTFRTQEEFDHFYNLCNRALPDFFYNVPANHPTRSISIHRSYFDAIWTKTKFDSLKNDLQIETHRANIRRAIATQDPRLVEDYKKMHRLDQKRILINGQSSLLFDTAESADKAAFFTLLYGFEMKVLNLALSIVINEKTLLDVIATFQSGEAFSDALEVFSSDAINAALTIQAPHHVSALHIMAQRKNSLAFKKLLSLCTPDTLAESAAITDENGYDLLELLFLNHDTKVIAKYIQRLAEAKDASAPLKTTLTRNLDQIITAMIQESSWQSKTFFLLFFGALGADFVLKLGQKMQEGQHKFAWLLSHVKSLPSLNALLAKPLAALQLPLADSKKVSVSAASSSSSASSHVASSCFIVTSTKRQIDLADAALSDAIWQEGFASFLEYQKILPLLDHDKKLADLVKILHAKKKLYSGTDMTYAVYQDYLEEKAAPLQKAIKNLPPHDFIQLMSLIPEATLDAQICELQAEDNGSCIQMAAEHLSEAAFSTLMTSVSDRAFETAIVIKNKLNKNTLHSAARFFSADLFIAFVQKIERMDAETLINAATLRDENLATPFHIAALYQEDQAFVELLRDPLSEAVKIAVSAQDHHQNTLLHIVVTKKSSETLAKFIAFVQPDNFNRAAFVINNDGYSILELALRHQPPALVVSLLNKMNDFTRKTVLSRDAGKPHVLLKIVDSLLHSPEWQDPALISQIFLGMGKHITPLLCEYWLDGNELSKHLMQCMMPHLADGELNMSLACNLMLPELHPWRNLGLRKPPEEKANDQLILTSKRTPLNLDDPDLVATLWREGLLNVSHFRRLRERGRAVPQVISTLDRLYQADCIFSGCRQALLPDNLSPIGLPEINQQIVAGNTIVQMVQPNDWEDTFHQLSDYQYRPKALQNALQPIYQYDHLTDQIVLCDVPDEKAEFTHTESCRVSFLGNGLNTNLIKMEERGLPKVGILYDRKRCIVNGMLTHEVDLANSAYIGPIDQVEAYAKGAKLISHTDFDSFTAAIKSHPYQTNVMLANLAAEAAFSICIAEDGESARALARQMAADFQQQFNRILPIIFYNPAISSTRLYFPEEMQADAALEADGVKVNLLAEEEAKARLLALKADILNKPAWQTYNLFGLRRAGDKRAKNAEDLLTRIAEAEKNPPLFWTKLSGTISKTLHEAIANRGYSRADETQDFYMALQKKYF
ncbi:MAG: hypothetical protein P4M14_13685 [Gammaproteobacteria bacterium]|nr:hypothetical protein [Gammaproteobacteria bacterium]